MLLNHIVQTREGRKSEAKRVIQRSIESCQQELQNFLKEAQKEIDSYYNKSHSIVSEVIEGCEQHIEGLNPYLSETVSHGDSKRFDFLLDYQEKLLTIILPKLA